MQSPPDTSYPIDAGRDDLSREAYCILGVPIDAIELQDVLHRIERAVTTTTPFFFSTPNINFLISSQSDLEFQQSLLFSDLNPVDGMPIVWIARLLGIPIKQRVAGSDIFEALKIQQRAEPLTVLLFGSTEVVGEAAAKKLNREPSGMRCVGWISPGFGNSDEWNAPELINRINASEADFLVAALGARNGQIWLKRNYQLLRIPVRCHLGAVINFEAGTVRRAPNIARTAGLEWLWRIKEEPALWKRYWRDGTALLRLLLMRVLPLAVYARSARMRRDRQLVIISTQADNSITLHLTGDAVASQATNAAADFRRAINLGKQVTLDLSNVSSIDARFVGLILMMKKRLSEEGGALAFMGLSQQLRRQFKLHGVESILEMQTKGAASQQLADVRC